VERARSEERVTRRGDGLLSATALLVAALSSVCVVSVLALLLLLEVVDDGEAGDDDDAEEDEEEEEDGDEEDAAVSSTAALAGTTRCHRSASRLTMPLRCVRGVERAGLREVRVCDEVRRAERRAERRGASFIADTGAGSDDDDGSVDCC